MGRAGESLGVCGRLMFADGSLGVCGRSMFAGGSHGWVAGCLRSLDVRWVFALLGFRSHLAFLSLGVRGRFVALAFEMIVVYLKLASGRR